MDPAGNYIYMQLIACMALFKKYYDSEGEIDTHMTCIHIVPYNNSYANTCVHSH